ncbi:TRAP transporter small permease [Thermodesulfobacteriota bacterium]
MENAKENNRLFTCYNKIIVFLSYVAGVLLCLITLAVTAEILVRKFGSTSLPWVIECSEHALVWIAFFAAAWVLREEAHIKVDLVLGFFKERPRALLNIINSLLGFLLCGFLTYRSALTIFDLAKRHIYTIKTLEIPMAPLYSVICIGSLLLTIQFFLRTWRYFENWKKFKKPPEKE